MTVNQMKEHKEEEVSAPEEHNTTILKVLNLNLNKS